MVELEWAKYVPYKDIAKYCPNTYHIKILPNEHHSSFAEGSSSEHEKVNSDEVMDSDMKCRLKVDDERR